MSIIAGALGLDENQSEYTFLNQVDREVVYSTMQETVNTWNQQRDAAERIFVGMTSSEAQKRYVSASTGRLQKMGFDPQGRPYARGASGYWDVAFPLAEFADRIAASRVTMGYMSVADLDRHVQAVLSSDANTTFNLILSALMDGTSYTYQDVRKGSLTIVPLANGDSVVYPPTLGAESGATDNHYLESGYAASAISDTNDPFPTMVDELEEHFGIPTGGSPIIVFINKAQTAIVSTLTDFVPIVVNTVSPGDQTATVVGLPPGTMLPNTARVLGTHADANCYIVRWDRIPANYMLALHMGVDKPLQRRIDPPETGLGSGALQMIVNETKEPFDDVQWSRRVGYAVANRLNGVVMELGTGGTYTTPSGFTASTNY